MWHDILSFAKEAIGPAAGWGTCYYATEPLDNPDYEKFADAFYDVFGVVPQLTTAAAMRKPERTKAYLEKAQGQYYLLAYNAIPQQAYDSAVAQRDAYKAQLICSSSPVPLWLL